MIQTKLSPSRLWLLIATIAGLCTSCSDITDSGGDTSLPDGKYPITFTAAVDGLTVSRTTSGKDAWTKDDPIAVSLNESSDSKTYQIVDASTGAMEPVNPSDVYYWKANTMKILAWYPATDVTAKAISDQSQGFADFDYLKAETTAKFSATGAVSLSFAHQMAKVTYTLTTDNTTTTDLSKATVSIYGHTQVSFTNGTVTGSGNGWITPTTDGQVLVVPQDMTGQKFIRVTISGREYFYTPDKNDDANGKLEAGMQYNYTITVKKEELEVTVNTYPSWAEGGSIGSGSAAEATAFNVYLSDFTESANTSDYKVTDADGNSLTASNGVYSNISSNEISISLSAAENYLLEQYSTKVVSGICKQSISYVADTRTYTYTFYDIRSDIKLQDLSVKVIPASSLTAPQVGDYYYSDGSWSTDRDTGKTCIGIVLKAGGADDDDLNNYGRFFAGGAINGYVVALRDAHADAGAWGIRLVDVNGIENHESSAGNQYDGYKNTAVVRQLDAYTHTDVSQPSANGQYWAFKVASEYAVTVPDKSSGWYLPSIQQLADIHAVSGLATRLGNAGGTDFKRTSNNGRYWSATEKNMYDAWYYQFGSSASSDSFAKSNDGGNYLRPSYVRAILTF